MMNSLMHMRVFKDNGDVKREKEDLTYMSFQNFRQDKIKTPISFFRSDFRGSSFSGCHFAGNNFDRADMISCVFLDCSFDGVNIAASEIKNCYFRNTIFTNNNYNHTSIQESTFENCEFLDEQLILNMKNCTLINCKLKYCTFERSTTESITFKDCEITNTDMATMHAENHKFIRCQIENTSMGISYIFGYLFYDTNLSNIEILYRGDTIKLTKEAILHNAKQLWVEYRFHEFLNANIICNKIKDIPNMISGIFEATLNITPQLRQLELCNIFEVLQFYVQNNAIPWPIYLNTLEHLETFDWKRFASEERLIYLSSCERLKLFVKDGCYNTDFILSAMNSHSMLIIHCNTNDYETAKDVTYKLLRDLSKCLGAPTEFELVDTQKGSWLFTFVVVTALALIIPKVISETVNVSLEVSTKLEIRKRLKANLKKQDLSMDELKKITEIASDAGLVKGSSFQITPSNLIDALKIQL